MATTVNKSLLLDADYTIEGKKVYFHTGTTEFVIEPYPGSWLSENSVTALQLAVEARTERLAAEKRAREEAAAELAAKQAEEAGAEKAAETVQHEPTKTNPWEISLLGGPDSNTRWEGDFLLRGWHKTTGTPLVTISGPHVPKINRPRDTPDVSDLRNLSAVHRLAEQDWVRWAELKEAAAEARKAFRAMERKYEEKSYYARYNRALNAIVVSPDSARQAQSGSAEGAFAVLPVSFVNGQIQATHPETDEVFTAANLNPLETDIARVVNPYTGKTVIKFNRYAEDGEPSWTEATYEHGGFSRSQYYGISLAEVIKLVETRDQADDAVTEFIKTRELPRP